ncbi:MAG: hypothetical protein RI967_2339 [Planctomycetota bacterium]
MNGKPRSLESPHDLASAVRSRRAACAAIAAPLLAGAFAPLAGAAPRGAQDGTDAPPPQDATPTIDPDASHYPAFTPIDGLAGTVRCVGSSSVGLLLNAIRPEFRDAQEEIEVEVVSSGSASAVRALADGAADLAPTSRPLRADEIALVEKARGAKVSFIDIAIDAIAFCVNRRNPIERLSLADLDRAFGRERRRGGTPATVWRDLGVTDAKFAERKIVLFGTTPGGGSYGLVREAVLADGAFRTSVNEEPVSSSVIQAIATDPYALGYCSWTFKAVRVRQLALQTEAGGDFIAPSEESIRSGRYPLARPLRVHYLEGARTSAVARQFLRFLLSQDGQEAIRGLDQLVIDPALARAEFARIGA